MPGSAYLVRTERSLLRPAAPPPVAVCEAVGVHEEELVEEIDSSCLRLPDEPAGEAYVYEHHVVFSPSYSVPVLYFRASRSDGSPLTAEEVWANIPHRFRADSAGAAVVSQNEHPVLGSPFFFMHPCGTADLMAALLRPSPGPGEGEGYGAQCACAGQHSDADRNRYLAAWLAAVGPAAGLAVSPHDFLSAATSVA
eukprot:tig00000492_g1478.t1